MFRAFSNAVGGMFGFSRALGDISNNIANMRVAGFRGSDAFFRSVSGDQPLGMRYAGRSVDSRPGEFSQTGIPTHLSLDGQGFHVLMNPDTGELRYTRAGDFTWKDNILVDRATGFRVMARDAGGNLVEINTSSVQQLPGQATTTVNVSGQLPMNAPTTGAEFTVKKITVYNAEGVPQELRLVMRRKEAASTTQKLWEAAIFDSNNEMVSSSWTEIEFGTGATPRPISGRNTVTATIGQQQITFDFGSESPTSGGVSLISGSVPTTPPPNYFENVLRASAKDGFAPPILRETSFDEDGVLILKYSDGKEVRGVRVARAGFSDETALRQVAGGLFQNDPDNPVTYGYSGEGPFGDLISGGLEGSNVDLVRSMGGMLEIQRGYQACSRVMTVADEMLKQAMDATSSGR